MGVPVLPTLALATYDTSLGAGRLSADWVPMLLREAKTYPECKGPLVIYNMGHGGWTSSDLLAGAAAVVSLRPTHILTEGGAINDCFDNGSGPTISLTTKTANNTTMLNQFLAGIPGVDLTVQTMSSVSASQTGRTQLGAYYANEKSTAAAVGAQILDLYPNWPKPLSGLLTNGAVPYSLPITSGFTSMGANLLWSPVTGTGLTVSADGLTVTNPSGSGPCLTSVALAGRIHFEIDACANSEIGVANSSISFRSDLGGSPDAVGLNTSTGQVISNSVVLGSLGFSVTFPIGVEVDLVANRVYFLCGSHRSAGFDISAIAAGGANIFPAASLFGTGSPSSVTAKFTNEGDGLHPIFPGAVGDFSYPSWTTWLRGKMAAFWP